MRDRLSQLIFNKLSETCRECSAFECTEELTDYLLANGAIVPPCKVGDKVYFVPLISRTSGIIELTVENIVVGINPSKCNLYCAHKNGSKDLFFQDSFGVVLFFTYEEAEAALKGGEE